MTWQKTHYTADSSELKLQQIKRCQLQRMFHPVGTLSAFLETSEKDGEKFPLQIYPQLKISAAAKHSSSVG